MRTAQIQVQKGFSIVEAMITLTIGLMLTAGVIQIVISNQVSDGLNRALASAQENGRFIMVRLKEDLLAAGRYEPLDPNLDSSVDIVEEGAFIQNRPVIIAGDFADRASLGSIQGENGANDTLVIAKQGERDCRGYKLGYATDVEFFVVNEYFVEDSTLKCRGFDGRVLRGQKIATGNNGDAAFTILDQVHNFQVLYGVSGDSGSGGVSGQAVTYVTASELANKRASGANVVSLKIAIVVEGDGDVVIDPIPTFKLLNETSYTPDGNGMYKKFETTISLRNMKHYVRNRRL